jgi:hypothetical protein
LADWLSVCDEINAQQAAENKRGVTFDIPE